MERLTEKDLAMYLGCECEIAYKKCKVIRTMSFSMIQYSCGYRSIRPILRPLSDITEEEKIEMIKAKHPSLKIKSAIIYNEFYTAKVDYFSEYSNDWLPSVVNGFLGPEQFKYLISKRFDLFGYIEKGLAIDKTKINETI